MAVYNTEKYHINNLYKVTVKLRVTVDAKESLAVSVKPNNTRLMICYTGKYSRLTVLFLPDHGCCLLVNANRTDIMRGSSVSGASIRATD